MTNCGVKIGIYLWCHQNSYFNVVDFQSRIYFAQTFICNLNKESYFSVYVDVPDNIIYAQHWEWKNLFVKMLSRYWEMSCSENRTWDLKHQKQEDVDNFGHLDLDYNWNFLSKHSIDDGLYDVQEMDEIRQIFYILWIFEFFFFLSFIDETIWPKTR